MRLPNLTRFWSNSCGAGPGAGSAVLSSEAEVGLLPAIVWSSGVLWPAEASHRPHAVAFGANSSLRSGPRRAIRVLPGARRSQTRWICTKPLRCSGPT